MREIDSSLPEKFFFAAALTRTRVCRPGLIRENRRQKRLSLAFRGFVFESWDSTGVPW